MGAVTRKKDIRQRRSRRAKRKRIATRDLVRELKKGRTHQDRVRMAEVFRQKAVSAQG